MGRWEKVFVVSQIALCAVDSCSLCFAAGGCVFGQILSTAQSTGDFNREKKFDFGYISRLSSYVRSIGLESRSIRIRCGMMWCEIAVMDRL